MKLEKRHLRMALTLLGLAVLWNVWLYVKAPAVKLSQAPLLSNNTQPPAPRAVDNQARVDPASIPAPPAVDVAAPPKWTRDAFLFGGESRDVKAPPAPGAAPSVDPTVRTILYSSGRRLAIINDKIVKVGDVVGENQVVDIVRDAVVFKTPSGERRRVNLLPPMPQGIRR